MSNADVTTGAGPMTRRMVVCVRWSSGRFRIVTTLNEVGRADIDIGLIAASHQHTGTAVETRDETDHAMAAVDTRYGRARSRWSGVVRAARGRSDRAECLVTTGVTMRV